MKVLVFCISAGLAAIAGALLASLFSYGLGTNYSSFASLTMVAILTITVVGDPWYAILAALAYGVVPGYITVANINTYLEIIFGLSAATFALQVNRALPVPLLVRNFLDRLGGRAPEVVLSGTRRRPTGEPGRGRASARARRATASGGGHDRGARLGQGRPAAWPTWPSNTAGCAPSTG